MTATTPTRRSEDTVQHTARLVVDWTRCDGHGLCRALAPDLIRRDEWGFPVLVDRREANTRTLRRAVAACPALALRLETR